MTLNEVICITSNAKLLSVLPGLSKTKTRVDISIPTHIFIGDIFSFQVPTTGPAAFLDIDVSARESFHMSKSF